MVKILYFARLREAFGCSEEQIQLSRTVKDVASLTQWLRERGGVWESELAPGRPVRVAVNQSIGNGDVGLCDGDEIAFFPPVTGG